MKKRSKIVLFIVLVLELQPLVSGAEFDANADVKAMKALYDKGVALYEKGEYGEAAAAFRELVEGRPKFQYYYNIGECEYMRERFDLAMEAFDIFIEKVGDKVDPEMRAHAEQVIEKVTPVLGYLKVDETAPLEVWVEGEHRGDTPLKKPIALMSGTHVVVLKDNGESVFETQISVGHGETVTVTRVEQQPEPPREEMIAAAPEPKKASQQPSKPEKEKAQFESQSLEENRDAASERRSVLVPLGFSILGIGAVSLAAGIATGAATLSKENKLNDSCPAKTGCSDADKNLHDSGLNSATASSVLLPIGGTLAVVGTALSVVGMKKNKRGERADSRSTAVEFTPMFGRSVSGVSVTGSF